MRRARKRPARGAKKFRLVPAKWIGKVSSRRCDNLDLAEILSSNAKPEINVLPTCEKREKLLRKQFLNQNERENRQRRRRWSGFHGSDPSARVSEKSRRENRRGLR